MKDFTGGSRLFSAGMLALALHVVILSQQLEYGKKLPTIKQFTQPITVSLEVKQVSRKHPAKEAAKKKPPRPVQQKSSLQQAAPLPKNAPVAKLSKPVIEKKKITPSKKQSFPDKTPPQETKLPTKQFQIEKEPASLQPEPGKTVSQPKEIAAQIIQQASPMYKINPPPEYPRLAKRRGFEGIVVIESLVDIAGKAVKVRIFTTSGHKILDNAALKAIRHWRFTPGSINGKQQEMWIKIPVRFWLSDMLN